MSKQQTWQKFPAVATEPQSVDSSWTEWLSSVYTADVQQQKK